MPVKTKIEIPTQPATLPVLITLNTWAARHDIPRQTAWKWANAGRIIGAYKSATSWLVPADAEVPAHRKAGRPPTKAKRAALASAAEVA